jgi:ankyrin repeat protein
VQNGNVTWVQDLLQQNCDPNKYSADGSTPLMLCVSAHQQNTSEHKLLTMAKLLLGHNADPNLIAMDSDHETTPMIGAVIYGRISIAKTLISYHADVNKFTGAVASQYSSMIQLLTFDFLMFQSRKTTGIRCRLCVAVVLYTVLAQLKT